MNHWPKRRKVARGRAEVAPPLSPPPFPSLRGVAGQLIAGIPGGESSACREFFSAGRRQDAATRSVSARLKIYRRAEAARIRCAHVLCDTIAFFCHDGCVEVFVTRP